MNKQQLFDEFSESLKSAYDSSMDIEDGVHQVSKLERNSKEASIESEKHLEQINGRVAEIGSGLELERKEREGADKATLTAAKVDNQGAKIRSWVAIGISILALLISGLANLDKIIANIELLSTMLQR